MYVKNRPRNLPRGTSVWTREAYFLGFFPLLPVQPCASHNGPSTRPHLLIFALRTTVSLQLVYLHFRESGWLTTELLLCFLFPASCLRFNVSSPIRTLLICKAIYQKSQEMLYLRRGGSSALPSFHNITKSMITGCSALVVSSPSWLQLPVRTWASSELMPRA